MKKKVNIKKRKQLMAALLPLLAVLILLCVPYTNAVFTGVFGYAVYAYFLLACAFSYNFAKGKRLKIPQRRVALYISIFIFIILTLHVAFTKDYIQMGWGSYLIDPFKGGTAGGMLMSAASCFFVVPFGYTISLVLCFVIAATLLFLAIFPVFIRKERIAGTGIDSISEDTNEKAEFKRRLLKTFDAEDKALSDDFTVLPPSEVKEESAAMQMFMHGKKQSEPFTAEEHNVFPVVEDISTEDSVYTNNYRRKILEQDARSVLFSPVSKKPTESEQNLGESGSGRYTDSATDARYADSATGVNRLDIGQERRFSVGNTSATQKAESSSYAKDAAPKEAQLGKAEKAEGDTASDSGTSYNIGNVFMPRKNAAKCDDGIYDDALRLRERNKETAKEELFPEKVEERSSSYAVKAGTSGSLYQESAVESAVENVVETAVENVVESAVESVVEIEEDFASEVTAAMQENVVSLHTEAVANRGVSSSDFAPDANLPDNDSEVVEPTAAEKPPASDWRTKLMEKSQRKEAASYQQTSLSVLEDKTDEFEEEEDEEELINRKPYVAPHLGLLSDHTVRNYSENITEEDYRQNKDVIETTLDSFGIKAQVVNAIKGPVVTRYEVNLISGSVTRVAKLKLDLTMRLSSSGMVDIIAPIEGKDAIGVDIPNKVRNNVSFRDIVGVDAFQNDRHGLKIALGRETDGTPYVADLEAMPHLLVAGATGKGKSVCINTIICSLLWQHSPDEVKFLLIDPKLVELAHYTGLPHMLIPEPLNDIPTVVRALRWVESETKRRYEHFKAIRKLSINAYNQYAKENGLKPKYKLVVIIDEASELMMRAKKETEEVLSSLARVGRAAGVHLIFATQSPTKDIITSEIQNNLNTKIAFAVGDYIHSMVIFKAKGAERLLGMGDMLLRGDGGKMKRIQCSFISTEEKERIVKFINDNNEKRFDEKIYAEIMAPPEPEIKEEYISPEVRRLTVEKLPQNDDVKRALIIGFRNGGISTSLLQRKMGKGFGVAGRIVDFLEENQLIEESEANTNRKRKILITEQELIEHFPEIAEEYEDFYMEVQNKS